MKPETKYDSIETLHAFREAAEITRRMKRLGISLTDALALLSDLLRGFEEYERQQEAEEALAFPAWMYRNPNDSRPEIITYVKEEVPE